MNQDNVINLTANAIKHINKTLEQEKATGFRLAVKKTGCSGYAYLPDIVKDVKADDIRVEVANVLIFIDKNSVQYLKGTLVDYIDNGLGQSKLVFHNPNAANLCGCGESFNLADE